MQPNDTEGLSLLALMRPEVLADPYPFYRRLQTEAPVHYDEAVRGWLVSRYADVVAILHDGRFVRARGDLREGANLDAAEHEALGPVAGALQKQMLFVDPPDHTRLRGLVNRAFSPRMVENMRRHIQAIADDLLEAAVRSGRAEIIRDFAHPLPFRVIREMLGAPAGDEERLRAWSDAYAAFLGGVPPTPSQLAQASHAVADLTAYLRPLVANRRGRPGDDLLHALTAAEEAGSVLDEEELVANCLLLLVAGHETTTNLIGNGLLALLRHPDQMDALKRDPSLLSGAVAELLRYESPIQFTAARAGEDITFGEKRIEAGQFVFLLLGAANRDPAHFEEPDRLDITRRDRKHLAFGHGIHYCLGAPLARLEGELSFAALLRHAPRMRLATEAVEWRLSMGFRGLRELPVAIE